jgi:hypothetical protein
MTRKLIGNLPCLIIINDEVKEIRNPFKYPEILGEVNPVLQ